MSDFVPTHRITHAATLRMLSAGVEKATAMATPVSLPLSMRAATCWHSCAWTVRAYSPVARPSRRRSPPPPRSCQPATSRKKTRSACKSAWTGDFTNVPGGFPILVEGQVVGGAGAGGATIEEDVEIAKAMLAALAL